MEEPVKTNETRRIIRLQYEKHLGIWHLVQMEMSAGVRKLLAIPRFDPSSPQPKQQHIRDIYDVLAAADLAGGSVTESFNHAVHEIVIEIRAGRASKQTREESYAESHHLTLTEAKALMLEKDPEHRDHEALFAEARRRLSTEEGSRSWGEHVRDRLNDPAGLYASAATIRK